MTLGQVIVIAGLHFTMVRVVLLFAWIRLVLRKEYVGLKLNNVDKFLILFVLSSSVIYTINQLSFEDFVNRLGFSYTFLGSYFLFRILIKDTRDIIQAVQQLVIIVVPLAGLMLIEKATGRNFFSVLGGVPEITIVREGKLRCQGAFAHPILAGVFGATLIPFFTALWNWSRGSRWMALVGLAAATIVTFATSSGGPMSIYALAVLGMAIWRYRSHMRTIRWVIFVGLVGLHVVMSAPVWHLMARLSNITGGGGWHRAHIIDQAIKHFGDWWFLGTRVTAHWHINVLPTNPKMIDLTNQYLTEGVNGGLVTMVLFVALILVAFREVGRCLTHHAARPFADRLSIWALGVVLFCHSVAFFSVHYFDQTIIFWLMGLAMIGSASSASSSMNSAGVPVTVQGGAQR